MAQPDTAKMTVFYDIESDVADIALLGGIGPNEVARSIPACGGLITLEFNRASQLIGIALHDMDMLYPDLARDAVQMRPVRDGDLQ